MRLRCHGIMHKGYYCTKGVWGGGACKAPIEANQANPRLFTVNILLLAGPFYLLKGCRYVIEAVEVSVAK